MTCDKVQELLTSYLDKELSEEEYNQVSIHLAQCSECSSLLHYIQEVQITFNDIPEVDPPERIRKNVMQSIVKSETTKAKQIGWQWKRAVAALILFTVSIATGLQPLFAANNTSDAAPMNFIESVNNNEPSTFSILSDAKSEPPTTYTIIDESGPKVDSNNGGDINSKAVNPAKDREIKQQSELTAPRNQDIEKAINEDMLPKDNGDNRLKSSKAIFTPSKEIIKTKTNYNGVDTAKICSSSANTKEIVNNWYEKIPKDRIAISVSGIMFSLILLWYSRPKKA
ncbi:zf-HC2 domain-containing protein [Clostridium sp. 'deep sea']|uniref:anti-sigma factor family protein n=1 Tax=Clostridium sp. 'deep sea' TaxID=2779445 RepID=UPI0018967377|nr:zf-HC2 domain-containing protein [Clostridium sp. 'deep sea']QOR36448.1 zf-HC2 domain-containing protein [Clostridium sp. 'deep sea']